MLQVVGVGSQDDFEFAQDFIADTGLEGTDSPVTMLWESSGAAWRLNNIMANSTLQLFTHDLTEKSAPIWFNDSGRDAILDAAPNEPWAGGGVSQ